MSGPTNTRFSLAVHVLALMADHDPNLVCSEVAASSAGTSPVHVRKVMSHLRNAGLVESHAGSGGGWSLACEPADISLADVWDAIYGDENVVALHPEPNPACAVGRNIGAVLDEVSTRATDAARGELATVSIQDVHERTLAGITRR